MDHLDVPAHVHMTAPKIVDRLPCGAEDGACDWLVQHLLDQDFAASAANDDDVQQTFVQGRTVEELTQLESELRSAAGACGRVRCSRGAGLTMRRAARLAQKRAVVQAALAQRHAARADPDSLEAVRLTALGWALCFAPSRACRRQIQAQTAELRESTAAMQRRTEALVAAHKRAAPLLVTREAAVRAAQQRCVPRCRLRSRASADPRCVCSAADEEQAREEAAERAEEALERAKEAAEEAQERAEEAAEERLERARQAQQAARESAAQLVAEAERAAEEVREEAAANLAAAEEERREASEVLREQVEAAKSAQ